MPPSTDAIASGGWGKRRPVKSERVYAFQRRGNVKRWLENGLKPPRFTPSFPTRFVTHAFLSGDQEAVLWCRLFFTRSSKTVGGAKQAPGAFFPLPIQAPAFFFDRAVKARKVLVQPQHMPNVSNEGPRESSAVDSISIRSLPSSSEKARGGGGRGPVCFRPNTQLSVQFSSSMEKRRQVAPAVAVDSRP